MTSKKDTKNKIFLAKNKLKKYTLNHCLEITSHKNNSHGNRDISNIIE